MLEGISGIELTASGLLLLVVLFIVTGVLVPRRTYNDLLRDRNYWQEAHKESEAQRTIQAKQIDTLLGVGHTVEKILLALPRAVEQVRIREEGDKE